VDGIAVQIGEWDYRGWVLGTGYWVLGTGLLMLGDLKRIYNRINQDLLFIHIIPGI
jgi:hypothetical protein